MGLLGIKEYAIIGLGIALLLALGALHNSRLELAAWEGKYNTFVAETKATALQDELNRGKITKEQEIAHAKLDSDKDARIATLTDLVRSYAKGRAGGSAVSGSATICNDAAQNKRLTDAISIHLNEVRAIIAGERTQTLGILGDAQSQTNTLIVAQDWIGAQVKANTQPKGK